MIKAQDMGERTKVEIAGTGTQLLTEFGQIIRSLNKDMPTELLRGIFELAVTVTEDEEEKATSKVANIDIIELMKQIKEDEEENNNK